MLNEHLPSTDYEARYNMIIISLSSRRLWKALLLNRIMNKCVFKSGKILDQPDNLYSISTSVLYRDDIGPVQLNVEMLTIFI